MMLPFYVRVIKLFMLVAIWPAAENLPADASSLSGWWKRYRAREEALASSADRSRSCERTLNIVIIMFTFLLL